MTSERLSPALKRLASAVQLRPWPPHFKALSYPGVILVLWVATHNKQNYGARPHYTTADLTSPVSSCCNTQP